MSQPLLYLINQNGKNELLKGVNTDSVRKILNEKYSSMQMLRSGIKAEKQLQELLKEYVGMIWITCENFCMFRGFSEPIISIFSIIP